MRIALALLSLVAVSLPAAAAETAWQQITPDARIRLVTSDSLSADQTTWAGLQVELAPGTVTYWRVPGETGIPLQLDLSASEGVALAGMEWPFPSREMTGGYLDHVYREEVTIPLLLSVAGDDPHLRAEALLGICSDICVPVEVSFDLPLAFGDADNASQLRIRQARARAPIEWEGDPAALGPVAFDAETGHLLVALDEGAIDPDSVIVTGSDTSYVFGAPQKSQIDGVLAFERLGWGEADDLTGQTLVLTFLDPSGPWWVAKPVVGIEELSDTE